MQEEFDSIKKNKTFELVELPQDRKAINCKWVYKLKKDKEGNLKRYKARLVARGDSQVNGVDYVETFSPVSRFTSIRALLAIANSLDMELDQMDFHTAFLN